jgi:hypothetical protein
MESGEESTFGLPVCPPGLGLITADGTPPRGICVNPRGGAADWMALAGQLERRELERAGRLASGLLLGGLKDNASLLGVTCFFGAPVLQSEPVFDEDIVF